MGLRISGKHMDIGDAFRQRIEERINDAVAKYFDGNFSGHVTVTKSSSHFSADCVVHLDTGIILQTTGQAQDPQLAFDAAAERIETRLRRYKRRLKSRKGESDAQQLANLSYSVFEPAPEEDDDLPQDYAPTIVAESSMQLHVMTVAQAVLELDLRDNPVLVFKNAGNDQINIVYRRADGNIGWIDPSAISQSN